jgi:hypothetical protein
MKTTWTACAIGLFLVGCSEDGPDRIPVEDNDIGVAYVEVTHDKPKGERLLTLRGFDQDGEEVAQVTLRTGRVLYADRWNNGTELTYSREGSTQMNTSPDRLRHQTDEPLDPVLASFVRLEIVASEIENEAGITFKRRPSPSKDGEVGYSYANCGPGAFASNKAGPSGCCSDHYNGTQLATASVVGWQQGLDSGIAYRNTTGRACRRSDGVSTGCGINSDTCYYGPCGYPAVTANNNLFRGDFPLVFLHPWYDWCAWDTDTSVQNEEGIGAPMGDYQPGWYIFPDSEGSSCTCRQCATDGTPLDANGNPGCANDMWQ